MKKLKLSIKNVIILTLIVIFSVIIFSHFFKNELGYVFFENNYLYIDGWFITHIINNILIAKFFYISIFEHIALVLGWEILENILLPSIFPQLNYFKEIPKDTFCDIISIIPALVLKHYKII